VARTRLESVVKDDGNDLVFGFIATRRGEVIAEAGDRQRLSHPRLVDTILQPEQAAAWYDRIRECEREDVRLIPQLYSLGSTEAVLGIPEDGTLVGLFGIMPEEVRECPPEGRARWLWEFRTRTWTSVRKAWAIEVAWE
jgi:hypothetical protein